MSKKPGFSVNDRVRHDTYGLGTIIEANERYVVIDFDERRVTKFLADVVRLERSDTPAPVKATRSRSAKAKAAR